MVSPSLASCDVSLPAAGARMSTLTLSVSMITITSSCSTMSPTFLFHFTMVPSVMLSPSEGTLAVSVAK